MNLTTKEAVSIAKSWVADQLSSEGVRDIGLEEVNFERGFWHITIGFSRSWDQNALAGITAGKSYGRSYKIIDISDESKEVTQMRNREAA
jgi:hypothetical protein